MSKSLATVLAAVGLVGSLGWNALAAPAPTPRTAAFSHASFEYRPVDLSGAGALVQPAKPLKIATRRAVVAIPSVWRCGPPRKLDNDATQTVKECATK
jgi:hypothetical protein